MLKNVAGQQIVLYAFDYTTGAPKTGDAAQITAYINKDWAGANALADTSAAEVDATNDKGSYRFDVSQAESNCDVARFSGKSSTANVAVIPLLIYTDVAVPDVNTLTVAGNSQTAGDLAALLAALPNAARDAVFAKVFGAAYANLTFEQMVKVGSAVLAGKLSGAATTTITIRNLGDTADVIVATVDALGNRTAITITP